MGTQPQLPDHQLNSCIDSRAQDHRQLAGLPFRRDLLWQQFFIGAFQRPWANSQKILRQNCSHPFTFFTFSLTVILIFISLLLLLFVLSFLLVSSIFRSISYLIFVISCLYLFPSFLYFPPLIFRIIL